MTKKEFAIVVARIKEELTSISHLYEELAAKGLLKCLK